MSVITVCVMDDWLTLFVCLYVCMYVCIYVCMYVCLCVCRIQYTSLAGKELYRLLKVPIDGYEEDVLTILRLEKYSSLMKVLDFDGRKTLALYLLQAVLDKDASVTTTSQVVYYPLLDTLLV